MRVEVAALLHSHFGVLSPFISSFIVFLFSSLRLVAFAEDTMFLMEFNILDFLGVSGWTDSRTLILHPRRTMIIER